jgi:hypothetical protein
MRSEIEISMGLGLKTRLAMVVAKLCQPGMLIRCNGERIIG